MRIAYFVENVGQVSETFVTSLIQGLDEMDVELMAFEDRRLSSASVPIDESSVKSVGFSSRGAKWVVWLGRLSKLLIKDDVSLNLRLYLSLKALVAPLKSFNPDVAYIDHGNNAILVREALVALNIPFVVHFHGRDASQLLGNADYLRQIQQVFRDATAIIVASHHIRRRLILAGCLEEKIIHVPYRVTIDDFPVPDWAHRRNLGANIIHLGRLVEKKNPLALVHAFQKVVNAIPEATLTFVGDGPLRQILEKRVADLDLKDSVRILGALEHSEALKEIEGHKIYAQHCVTDSRGDQEGFNISLMEAAILGLPVVSTLHDGIPENVVDGETGFLVPEYNYETMASRIVELLNNPDLTDKMGKAGRKHIETNFPIESRAKSIYDILNRIAVIGNN